MDDKEAKKIADLITRQADSEIQKSIGVLQAKVENIFDDISEIKETNIRIFKRLDYTPKKERCKENEDEIKEMKKDIDSMGGEKKMLRWVINIILTIWLIILTALEVLKNKLFH
ncbi:MAG: hypothetical protein BAJALOKI1v1_2690003 [Promethearchaeota archaeon]|nr:MAG: hypothetical protein BAJALOKI1v1_2690003 [Candidatus Lokiarchaeota archaeon]